MDLHQKIYFYFFDPFQGEDEYSNQFISIVGEPKAYSPLYLMRRHALFCTGKLFSIPPTVQQLPYFASLIIAKIALEDLRDLIQKKDTDFYRKYFSLLPIQADAMKILRNGFVHNHYQLFHRVKNDNFGKYYFKQLSDYLVSNKQIEKKYTARKDFFYKVAFELSSDPNDRMIKVPFVEKIYDDENYALVRYGIQPFIFLDQFEKAINLIKKDIEGDESLMKYFDETITIDNWMKVGYIEPSVTKLET